MVPEGLGARRPEEDGAEPLDLLQVVDLSGVQLALQRVELLRSCLLADGSGLVVRLEGGVGLLALVDEVALSRTNTSISRLVALADWALKASGDKDCATVGEGNGEVPFAHPPVMAATVSMVRAIHHPGVRTRPIRPSCGLRHSREANTAGLKAG